MNTAIEVTTALTRPLATVILIATVCYGFIVGKIPQEVFMPVAMMAISFWFGARSEAKRKDDK